MLPRTCQGSCLKPRTPPDASVSRASQAHLATSVTGLCHAACGDGEHAARQALAYPTRHPFRFAPAHPTRLFPLTPRLSQSVHRYAAHTAPIATIAPCGVSLLSTVPRCHCRVGHLRPLFAHASPHTLSVGMCPSCRPSRFPYPGACSSQWTGVFRSVRSPPAESRYTRPNPGAIAVLGISVHSSLTHLHTPLA
jgi:hypothetical protein